MDMSEAWRVGWGVIRHGEATQQKGTDWARKLVVQGRAESEEAVYQLLVAADRVASAAMWLVVQATYARRVYLDGRALQAEDCKLQPEGHLGGSLNMVPAYVGYLLANALSGNTRSWMMGQGHCVAAVDAVNVLVGNTVPLHAERYPLSDGGLSRFVQDFYSYAITPQGEPASLLGSHVHAHTAGGTLEGGYLGFAELQYVHMPLPGESLVTFLSDGAFEEQRGSDWAPRWWRAGDCGWVCPILIANGRRIDQRSLIGQEGGAGWLQRHLRLNDFNPFVVDGRDPAAIAWAILEMEERLDQAAREAAAGRALYPVRMPYAIAETEKGYGFYGAGTNAAHNLPLVNNPAMDTAALAHLVAGLRALWVPETALREAVRVLCTHDRQRRPRERDHAGSQRNVVLVRPVDPGWSDRLDEARSPMGAIDGYFVSLVRQNPTVRVRLGNPDELRSNGMQQALDVLQHRVCSPERGVAESIDGRVITALNEEAVVCAALGNKAGLNLVVTYEAFAPKMIGALRQEITFVRKKRNAGQAPGWISVPVVLTSHTWENGKNELSHQDTTCCEALLGEMSDASRVLFPCDWNSTVASMAAVYQTHGNVVTMVVPKRALPQVLLPAQAEALAKEGAIRLSGTGEEGILLVAVGAYQLQEIQKASRRLTKRGIPHGVLYMLEPGRFRTPRDSAEKAFVWGDTDRARWFPGVARTRIFLGHMRPHVLMGVLRTVDTGPQHTHALGFINRGGTLNTAGMLFANQCTWGHVLERVACAEGWPLDVVLTREEQAAVQGRGDPALLG